MGTVVSPMGTVGTVMSTGISPMYVHSKRQKLSKHLPIPTPKTMKHLTWVKKKNNCTVIPLFR